MYSTKKWMIVILVYILVMPIFGQQLLRGPYLQSLLPTGIKILWRTDVPSISKIEYGTDLNQINQTVYSDSLEKDHVLELKELSPSTTYYYKVYGDNLLAGGDEWHHFTTAPIFGSRTHFSAWILGDFGSATQDQIAIKRSFLDYAAQKPVDFWMWLGDNTYTTGKDAEYQTTVFSKDYGYDSIFRYLPFYPTPGNHDYGSVVQNSANGVHRGPYFNIIDVFQHGEAGGEPSNTEKYYSYNYGNVHFISLNSEAISEVFLTDMSMKNWLINDLKNNKQQFTIAYWHQCPYSKGSHDSDAAWELIIKSMRENYVPILEQYNVDLVICGHSHVFERSYLLHGHYGKSSTFDPATMIVDGSSGNFDEGTPYRKIMSSSPDSSTNGTVYIVCGNGGKSEDNPPLNHPAFFAVDGGSGVNGSLILDVEEDRLDIRYLRKNGTVGDYFSIIKEINTGVLQNELKIDRLKIFPNPSKKTITLELSLPKSNYLTMNLMDINGKILGKIYEGNFNNGYNNVNIDLSKMNLPSGNYFISIENQEHLTKMVKIIVLE